MDARQRGARRRPEHRDHLADPRQRLRETETLVNPPGAAESDGYLAEAMAVDGATLYLYVPRIGIVAHDFVTARPCG